MTKYYLKKLGSALLPLAMVSCSTNEIATPVAIAPEPTATVAASEVVVRPQRPIPADSLLPLLIAEFALRRQQMGTALDHYLTQSALLKDAGVSAHTARLAQYLKRDQDALKAALQWVELAPDDPEARLVLANLLARGGDPVTAATHMSEVLRSGGRANFTALAVAAARQGDKVGKQFLIALEPISSEFPDNIELMLSRTILLQEMEKLEPALNQVREVIAVQPEQRQAVVLEAQIMQQMGMKADAFTRLQTVLEGAPNDDKLRLQYARLLTRTNLGMARDQFQLLVDAAPSDSNLLYSLALVSKELGETNRARNQFQRLLTLTGRQSEAHFYLGRIFEAEENADQALVHYKEVTAGPDFQNAHRRVAALLLAQQKYAASTTHFADLRGSYPNFHEAIYLLEADSLGQVNELERSKELLNEALAELPGNISLLYARSMINEKMSNLETMEADLRSILKQEPNNATALNALGYTLANNTDRYPEALELIARALELNPGEPAILDSMGWIHFRLGQYEAALKFLRLAFQAFPDPEVAAHLGEAIWATGEEKSARTVWLDALKQHPDHHILLEVIRRLSPSDIPTGT